MTAICKVIPIHSKNIEPIIDYVEDMHKTDVGYASHNSESDYMKAVFDYTENPLKTQFGIDDGHEELLISGVNCAPENAVFEFAQSKQKYLGSTGMEQSFRPFEMIDPRTQEKKIVIKEPVQAIHLIQSFSETDLDPRVIHQIGCDLVDRLGANFQAVVSTHMNKQHVHNHIVINSFSMDGKGKIPCNRSKLMEIRQISDDLQREYGIEVKFATPEQQLRISKSNGRHNSYQEWKQAGKNNSWKLQMMTDIVAIRQMVETKEEFIEMMNDFGYSVVRQSEDSITWMNHEAGKKIRDTTLGQDFTLGQLFAPTAPTIMVKSVDKEAEQTTYGTISIARYDWDGRKRSELEMLVRKVIAIIQKVQTMFERLGNIQTTHTPKYKLQLMDEALSLIKTYGIKNKADLKERVQEKVSKYNHYKSEIARTEHEKDWYSSISLYIKELDTAQESLGGHLLGADKTYLPTFTEQEIRKNKAKQFPMTSKQKKELYYQCSNHPEWHLAYKYEELSALDAQKILNYFDGRGSLPADLLLTKQEYFKRINENKRTKKETTIPPAPKEELDELFFEGIKDRPIEHKLFFNQLRNQMIYLASMGINPYDLDAVRDEIACFDTRYEELLQNRDNYCQQYKELLKLQQAISYAEIPSFIYGPMWDDKKNEPILVQEKEERDTKSEEKQAERNKSDLPKTENPFNMDMDL